MRTKAYAAVRRQYPGLVGHAYISSRPVPQGAFYHWDVIFFHHGKRVLDIDETTSGRPLHITRGVDIGWTILQGSPGTLGEKLNAPYIWLPLCVLFLLPFFDPRRPFRLLHLDLAVLLLFGVSQFFFTAGKPSLSVPLIYPCLVYVVVRSLFAVFRPRRVRDSLAPLVSTRFLVAGLLVLMGLRIAFVIAGSVPFDIAEAGVVGADRIEHRQQLYVNNNVHGDTYGPVNYLLYVPAELALPYKGTDQSTYPAARATTIGFDVAILLVLVLLGIRLRPGAAGRRLAALLGWAWAAFPYSALVLAADTNDMLVPLFALLALSYSAAPVRRGLISALGAMAKFVPLLLAPLFAVGRGPFRWRPALVVAGCYVLVSGGLILAFLPAGGLREFWDCTLGFQLQRQTPLAIWLRYPGLDPIKPLFTAIAIGFALAAVFVPRRRTVAQLAAWCAAILATIQIGGGYWIYFYIIWFAPFLFVALFEEHTDLGPAAPVAAQASVTRALVNPEMISQPSSVTATRSSIRTPRLSGT